MGAIREDAPIYCMFPYLICITPKKNKGYGDKRINRLNFFNYILGYVFDVELQGYVHSEED